MPEDGLVFTGDVLRQHRSAGREHAGATSRSSSSRRGADGDGGAALADVVGRVQALHPRRVPRRLPDRRALPHRVRHGRRAAGRLQRLRLLRAGLSVRRASTSARGATARGVEVHALLRPPEGRPRAGLRAGVPDRLDPVRSARRAARRAADRVAQVVHERGVAGARLYGEDPDDGVGGFGAFFLLLDEPQVYGLPPARSTRPAHLARDVAGRRGGRGRPGGRGRAAFLGGRR